jgi:hypothetical protein
MYDYNSAFIATANLKQELSFTMNREQYPLGGEVIEIPD